MFFNSIVEKHPGEDVLKDSSSRTTKTVRYQLRNTSILMIWLIFIAVVIETVYSWSLCLLPANLK